MDMDCMETVRNQRSDCQPDELPPSAKMALALIFRRFAGLSFKLERLPKAAEGRTTAADLRAAVPVLLHHRCLVSVRNASGERLFFIPHDIAVMIQVTWMRPQLAPIGASRIMLVREAKRGLALDLLRSLVWIAKHGLPVTVKGSIHQRSLAKLSGQTALQPEDVTGLELEYPDKAAIPASTAVVLDLLLELGLIIQAPKAWQLNLQVIAIWLKRNVNEMNVELYRQILLKYIPPEAELQHFVYALSSSGWRPGEWFSLEILIQWLQKEKLLRPNLPEEWLNWLRGWLEAMCGFGWLELGCSDAGDEAFRWTEPIARIEEERNASQQDEDWQAEKHSFYVQPDFEVMVPPEVPFAFRWELDAFSECISADRMSVYRLTRESIAEGVRLGRSWREALRHLQRSLSGVPGNVALALEEWGRQLGEPEGGGIYPRLEAFLAKTDSLIDEPDSSGKGWIFCGEDRSAYRVYDTGLQPEELFPGLGQVPAMWLKTARGYHPSTAREMVSQAIKWHAKLALEIKGQMYEYLPTGLQEEMSWQVTGRLYSSSASDGREAVLAPDDWEVMRLLLPEEVTGYRT